MAGLFINRMQLLIALVVLLGAFVMPVSTTKADTNDLHTLIDLMLDNREGMHAYNQQRLSASVKNTFDSGIRKIDATAVNCAQQLKSFFNVVLSIGNPFTAIFNAILSQILSLITQVCQMLLSALNEIKSSVMSIFNLACVPLPKLNLSGSLFKLPKIPCNGTNLLSPSLSPAAAKATSRWDLFGVTK